MHIVSTPNRLSRRRISWAIVARIRAPVAPTGWPNEIPEPLGLSRSSVGSTFHSRRAREHLGGEGLVELDDVDLVQGEAGPLQGGGGGRDGTDAHHIGADAGDGPRPEREQWPQAPALGLVAGGHDAHRGAVILAACVAGGDGRLGVDLQTDRPQGGQVLEGRLGTRVLVAVDHEVRLASPPGDRHRDQLVGEAARIVGRAGTPLRPHRQLVLLFAGDGVLPAQVLGRLQHSAGHGWSFPPAVSRARSRRSMRCTPPARTPVRSPRA